jgi:hypothetical protein
VLRGRYSRLSGGVRMQALAKALGAAALASFWALGPSLQS